MKTCEHCPFPRRCEPAERCIAYKKDAEAVILPEPAPVPVVTTSGVGMTGKIKSGKKAKTNAKLH
ncbi:hypothetical protein FAMCQIZV_CDS0022 [Phage C72C1]|nr:hypothetical protein FAMCQIZV_CDS0022 [Phage C72C1]